MMTSSKLAAILCSIMAVTQLSGCDLLNSNSQSQVVNYDAIKAPSSSFFSNRPSDAKCFENTSLASKFNVDNVICLTYIYDTYLTVEERYGFTADKYVIGETIIYPGECNSPQTISQYTQGAISANDLVGELGGYYRLVSDSCVLLPGVSKLNLSQTAELLKTITVDIATNPGVVTPMNFDSVVTEDEPEPESEEVHVTIVDNGLSIEELSEDTLTMSKYTMRVSLGQKRQIAIAQCPRDYINKVLFISDNPSVATVDSKGYVTAHRNGTATITVTLDGAAGYSSVMVYVY